MHPREPMKKVTKEERELVVEILANSFHENPSVNYIIKPDNKRVQRIRALMAYSFDICNLFGKVFLNEQKTGCALIMYPHNRKSSLKAILLDLKLIINAIGIRRAGKAMRRDAQIKNCYAKEPFYHIWFIGVHKLAQHQGEGSRLLYEVIKDAESQNLPIFLETSNLKNISWYESFKFEVYDKIQFNYTLFILKRP